MNVPLQPSDPADLSTPIGEPGCVAVLIPALNEEASLPGVLAALPESVRHRVVVDNGSSDGTANVARAAGAEVVFEPRRGYGSACLAGLEFLAPRMRPHDVLVFLDADHSDDPTLVSRLAAPVLLGRRDLVLGVRTGLGIPVHARLGNAVVLAGVRLLYGRQFQDVPPFRAVRWDVLHALAMDDRDYGWTLQMQLRALRAHVRIEEMEVPYQARAAGLSKVSGSWRGSIGAGLVMLRTVVRERGR